MVEGISIANLLERADAAEDLLLVDVRNEEDFAGWRLEARAPVETVHIPYFDFLEDAEASIARSPKEREVVVLCAKGGSSEMVADLLVDAGRRARNVEGGMAAYGNHLESRAVPLPSGARHEIHQVLRRGKGCLAHVVRSGKDVPVVDPSRHVAFYEALVADLGARIVHVLDTHVHADHVSGGRELARRAKAPYTFYPKEPLSISVGEIVVEVLPAPGHTPDSCLAIVARDHVLTGDTLFVSSVGRPDLGGDVAAWARALYRTLRERVDPLPDATVVLPAHYASPAEIGRDGIVSGRIGDLRRQVPEMALRDEGAFVRAMESSARPAPEAYVRIVKVNQGLLEASESDVSVWELGRNECAASAPGGRKR
jgi:glyoxylase-like metal-dependent hydrolase (beta-lactamase superfamily II)/rhodanese-related sulfurtransferase